MHSVQAGIWDPRPPSKHGSPLPTPPPSRSRLAHVTTATPAKRITFYKSGDNQFGGVRMAIHKRSFKCFDALLDDLSQKVPLPFGVRTVTTPRGTHTIKHLEQLQDGGCYLCSDQRHAKPVNIELAGKRPSMWYHHGRRPHRPETVSTTPPGHLHFPYRQRRILLVKNSEPGIRRSVLLSRRSTRSLRAFLDEVSEVMQFHVRKLYTLEGRKIDNVQSLMSCPGVLVCVGREAFSPMLVNLIRKSSEEKMPGLGLRTPGNGARSPATQAARSPPHGAQSRASQYSEGHESKKNINFGLETKKSIIHPRSDSSNRSARFSLSSEKSYGNGVCTYPQMRPAIMNDDIEKRVLVNKDGSLSVEMRVRFRLHNDETLQWSTQIRKSPSLMNECCPLSEAQPHYLQQGQSESCSDPDSTNYDPEGMDYSSQPSVQDGSHCPCCYHRQEQKYDLWENPAHSHKHLPHPPQHTSCHTIVRHTHSSSSSSSCSSRRVVRCRARLSNCGNGSGSEQSQLVQEEMCVTEQVEHRVEVEQDGDTHVEVCRVSQSCSRSEVIAVDSNEQPPSGKSGEVMMEEDEERPVSAVSSSSRVLQSLKEDQDDEEDDLPSSASQCCYNCVPCQTPTLGTPMNQSPKSNVSIKHQDGSRAASADSSCHCAVVTGEDEMEQAPTGENITPPKEEKDNRSASGLSGQTGVSVSSKKTSSVCPNCGGCKRGFSSDAGSRASQLSNHATSKPSSPRCNPAIVRNGSDDAASDGSAVSTQSNKSNLTDHGRTSAASNALEGRASSAMSRTSNLEKEDEEKAPSVASATSQRSNKSRQSNCYDDIGRKADVEEERSTSKMSAQSSSSHKSTNEANGIMLNEEMEGERTASSLSVKSGASTKTGASVKSHKSNCQSSVKAASPSDNTDVKEDDKNNRAPSCLSVKSGKSARSDGTVSAKSNVSAKTSRSGRSTCSHCAKPVSPSEKAAEEAHIGVGADGGEAEEEERAASEMSAKSNLSVKSKTSQLQSDKMSVRSRSAKSEDRAASEMSGKSVKSNHSVKSKCSGLEEATENEDHKDGGEAEDRAASALSDKSASSLKSHYTNAEAEEVANRPSSAISTKSHISAKSVRSHKSNQTAASLNLQMNTDQNQERLSSALSTRSKSSQRSSTSHKSSSSKKSSNTHVVTIKTPVDVEEKDNIEGGDEEIEDNDATQSIASELSHDQMLSPKGTLTPRTRSPKVSGTTPTGIGSKEPSGLSVQSPTSVKSGRSKCQCGATSAKKDNEEKDEEENEDLKGVEASDGSGSVRSSSSRGHSASRNSSGSVSLGLPEDQDAADTDSVKSSVSFQRNAEGKATSPAETTSPVNSTNQNGERAGSSNSEISKSPPTYNVPAVDIPTIETPGGGEGGGEEDEEQKRSRAASAFSVKSSVSRKSCKCSIKSAAQKPNSRSSSKSGNDAESEITKPASTEIANDVEPPYGRTSSAMSSISTKREFSGSAIMKNGKEDKMSTNDDVAHHNSQPASEAKEEENIARNEAASVNSQSRHSVKPESVASAQSESKSKASKKSKGKETLKPDYLKPVQVTEAKSSAGSDNGSVKTSGSQKKKHMKTSSPCPVHSKMDACSESTLSAADLLKETIVVARPSSQRSKSSKASNKPTSVKSVKHQKRDLRDQEQELTPSYLPNASPNEVVSDWLRSIPADSCMLAPDDALNEDEGEQVQNDTTEMSAEHAAEEEENTEDKADVDEENPGADKLEEKEDEVKCDAAVEENHCQPPPGGTSLSNNESLPKNWQSTAAVMKVLLSSSLGRCRSMPEVSPVYGRRLSTSARGLLDCLAQLQLIEPAVNPGNDLQKDRISQYEDIMAILHSLWLTEPRDLGGNMGKEGVTNQMTPPRSSSGVGMSSGSGGSGKENRNQEGDETPPNKSDSLQEEEAIVGESEEAGDKDTEASAEQSKTDTTGESDQAEDQSPDSPKATENPSSSDKSSANGSSKSPTDNEQEIVEDSSSATPPTVVRAPLSKRPSQDPDPVWVLHLLKKLEKQFMSHYIDAMTEFKVRWDLDDSVILDTMICELKDEVSQRIQKSVQREMLKIQSRAGKVGRSPRPPQGANLSRESTMTEKRRRMLKVMKNQSVKTADSLSDGEMTGDFSDQRSEDEYCPCDACVRKKMAARPFKENPQAVDAPVMIEFDLLKILQLKKSPAPKPPVEMQPEEVDGASEGQEEEKVKEKERSLEVVQEEEEEYETKEDIKALIVLEETIAEVDEEEQEEEEEEEEEAEAKSEEKEENSGGNEEQDEEEEEEAECECHAKSEQEEAEDAINNTDEEKSGEEEENAEDDGETGEEETGENEGESGSGDEEVEEEEEEESDNNTVKEASVGERESTDNEKSEKDEGEKEEDKEEADAEEASESREEEEEESTGDNNVELPTNEESPLAEEIVEGDVSASAEAEDEDEDGNTEDVELPEEDTKEEVNGEREEVSEEDNVSPKGETCICVTEGEEGDCKSPSDAGGDGDGEEAVEELKPEEEAEQNGAEDAALLHQITRTSVESQPGSMEDVDADSPLNMVESIEVPKVGGGGGGSGHRRSRSPARVKRRKPKETCGEMENC